MLDSACLGALYLRGERWPHAAGAYRVVQADDRRIDFQMNWLLALWQGGMRQEAYRLARTLSRRQPHLLVAWAVLGVLGDVNDRTLRAARLRRWTRTVSIWQTRFRLPIDRQATTIRISTKEAELLKT